MSTPFGNISEKAGRVVGWAEKKDTNFLWRAVKKNRINSNLKIFFAIFAY